eukprot:gnl/TRDRNA2_/TRDRNA2_60848_c0_seq1.p1 gnl/TRDRNA2_/TRDRNA2_60848_c0~~gnl/TRDRNA2_/TRDRNA2_60848_c0_seq1.p1  ORF type:complete len:434 (+),score=82.51 gnl/TRDRNA2_/TRDRNA2_60848_c0_seq1:59-1360(+)
MDPVTIPDSYELLELRHSTVAGAPWLRRSVRAMCCGFLCAGIAVHVIHRTTSSADMLLDQDLDATALGMIGHKLRLRQSAPTDSSSPWNRVRLPLTGQALPSQIARRHRSARSSQTVVDSDLQKKQVVSVTSQYSLIASSANLPHPAKAHKGGEDAWLVKADESGGGLMAVADGVGGYADLGIDPGMYARVLAYEVAQAHNSSIDQKAVIAAAQKKTKLLGAATLCMVEVDGTRLRAANVGDSGLRVIRDGEIVLASEPGQKGFNHPHQLAYPAFVPTTDTAEQAVFFDFPIQPGDLVVAATDGLFDNVFDDDILRVATNFTMPEQTALDTTKEVSEALLKLARKHAEDRNYPSPFSLELANYYDPEVARGGKMDDITVLVGKVVATAEATADLHEAVAASEKLAESMRMEREKAKEEEGRLKERVRLLRSRR